jgi:glucose/arabinose dehydrogenase
MMLTFSSLHRWVLTLFLLASTGAALAKTAYTPQGDCAGLPRIAVTTPAGFCLGLLADGFAFPRGLQPLANGDLLLVDMGGWMHDGGSVWLLQKSPTGYQRRQLFAHLDRPNGIALGPDGLVYVGTVKRIFRFDPRAATPVAVDVIGGRSAVAPLPGIGRHLLTAMVFDRNGDLFVNVGSGTDHCERADGSPPDSKVACPETSGANPLGVIRKYTMQWPAGTVLRQENFARGLRNSMALAFHPVTGELWQGENSRDAINLAIPGMKNDEELPHDELNLIAAGGDYGWPYCYDNNLASPEYPDHNCRGVRPPAQLLPAHAAPLGMAFYGGRTFPPTFANSLLIGFHGYRQHGHRLVAMLPDKAGAPLGRMVDLVSGWGAKPGQPMGAPVAVVVGADGAVYMTEDRNGTVLRLAYVGK